MGVDLWSATVSLVPKKKKEKEKELEDFSYVNLELFAFGFLTLTYVSEVINCCDQRLSLI